MKLNLTLDITPEEVNKELEPWKKFEMEKFYEELFEIVEESEKYANILWEVKLFELEHKFKINKS